MDPDGSIEKEGNGASQKGEEQRDGKEQMTKIREKNS